MSIVDVLRGQCRWHVEHGESRTVLRGIRSWSIDAVVCDPPYGLGFMGREWDQSSPAFDSKFWREVLRVARPGAHLVAFGGTRCWHHLAVAIENGGWEIRDSLAWIYGQGFPKSLDVAKAIDKRRGHWRGRSTGVESDNRAMGGPNYKRVTKGDPVTAAAAEWDGFGTALRPSIEPIVLARAPLGGSVGDVVQEHGVGALNLAACRIGAEEDDRWPSNVLMTTEEAARLGDRAKSFVVFDSEYDEPYLYAAKPSRAEREAGLREAGRDPNGILAYAARESKLAARTGGVAAGPGGFEKLRARRAHEITGLKEGSPGSKHPRSGKTADNVYNVHTTVKPISMMRWLVRLATPSGGVVLDPFTGSGTTGIAAVCERMRFIGIEMNDTDDEPFVSIARARIAHWERSARGPNSAVT